MENYISVNGQRIELTQEQIAQILAAYSPKDTLLADVPVGEVVKIGGHEMVVLEQGGETTALIRKELIPDMEFGANNNYAGSYVDAACESFADEIAAAVGEENLVLHTVDLTSDDGLKDYGEVERRASLITADQYRRYVSTLDLHRPGEWWWLATAYSTQAHDNDRWIKCVSPAGNINYVGCNRQYGVRPFCILKSTIFVSK